MRALLVVVALVVSGCTAVVDDATAVPEPRKVDCDLIFPPVVAP